MAGRRWTITFAVLAASLFLATFVSLHIGKQDLGSALLAGLVLSPAMPLHWLLSFLPFDLPGAAVWLTGTLSWAGLGALIGLQLDNGKTALSALARAAGASLVLVVLFAPVFPWGSNLLMQLAERPERNERLEDDARARSSPKELDAVLGEAIAQLAASKGRESKLRAAADRLDDLLANKQVPKDVADRHVPRLIAALKEHGPAIEAVGGADVVRLLPLFASSPEAKAYMLEVLRGPDNRIKEQVIRYLYWTRTWVGDAELFDALAPFADRQLGVLASMQRIDPKRVKPLIRERLLNTKDAETFQRTANLVHESQDDELFETMLLLIPKFGRPVWAKREDFDRYLAGVEGEKLQTAMQIINGEKYYSDELLLKKLQSKDPKSREACYTELGNRIKKQYLRRKTSPLVQALEAGAANDPDPAARKAAKAAHAIWLDSKFLH